MRPRSERRGERAPGVDLRTAEGARSAVRVRGLTVISVAGGPRRRIGCPMGFVCSVDTSLTDITGVDSVPVCTAGLVSRA